MVLRRDHKVPASVCSQNDKHNMAVWGLRLQRKGQGCESIFLAWEHWRAPSRAAQAVLEKPASYGITTPSPLLRGPGEWVAGQLHSAAGPTAETTTSCRWDPQPRSLAGPPGPHTPF